MFGFVLLHGRSDHAHLVSVVVVWNIVGVALDVRLHFLFVLESFIADCALVAL